MVIPATGIAGGLQDELRAVHRQRNSSNRKRYDFKDTGLSSSGENKSDKDTRSDIDQSKLNQLVQDVCAAVDKGDLPKFFSILKIVSASGDYSLAPRNDTKSFRASKSSISPVQTGTCIADEIISFENPPRECNHLLHAFYNLVGFENHYLSKRTGIDDVRKRRKENSDFFPHFAVPISVRPGLLLRSLLRIPHDRYLTPWEAVTAAIKLLQSSKHPKHSRSALSLSHGEALGMMAEIRSFVGSLRSSLLKSRYPGEPISSEKEQKIYLALKQLYNFGVIILEPLLHVPTAKYSGEIQATNLSASGSLRSLSPQIESFQNLCFLPLDLIPIIICTADLLEEKLRMVEGTQVTQYTSRDINGVRHGRNESSEQVASWSNLECVEKEATKILPPHDSSHFRVSDRLLTVMLSFSIDEHSSAKSQRSTRADAVLPVFGLIVNDLDPSRMSAVIPMCDGVTYWDALRTSLDSHIQSTLACYSVLQKKNQLCEEGIDCMESGYEHLLGLLNIDDGAHIIPQSDYSGLIRHVIRMISTNVSNPCQSTRSMDKHSSPSWESLLLRLYYAAATVTPATSFPPPALQMKQYLTALAKIESYVLLPSFASASALEIRSILGACMAEYSPSCQENITLGEGQKGFLKYDNTYGKEFHSVPSWAVARVVLLVMLARTPCSHYGAKVNGFGPRTVFYVAANLLRSKGGSSFTNVDSAETVVINDESAEAAIVLVDLCRIKAESYYSGRDGDNTDIKAKYAHEVLQYSYYAKHAFHWRYKHFQGEVCAHRQKVGLEILSSYADLVCSGLYQDTTPSSQRGEVVQNCITDNANTWVVAANIILDFSYNATLRERVVKPPVNEHSRITLAIVIFTVVFFEIPSARRNIVRSLRDRLIRLGSQRNIGDLSRNPDDSCFVLISILAWSLVAHDETYLPIAATTRKDRNISTIECRFSNPAAVLEPLCDLLLRPALSPRLRIPKAFASEEGPCLSHWALHKLTHSLVSVSPGRKAILLMAKKNMQLFFATRARPNSTLSKSVSLLETSPHCVYPHGDVLYFALSSLCALIMEHQPLSTGIPDKYGLEALGIVTDFIVLRHDFSDPNYRFSVSSIRVQSWLIRELHVFASKSLIPLWISQRLLRACFVALIKSFLLTETKMELKENGCHAILLPKEVFLRRGMLCNHGNESEWKKIETEGANKTGFLDLRTLNENTFEAGGDVPALLRLALALYSKVVANDQGTCPFSFSTRTNHVKIRLLKILLSQPSKPYNPSPGAIPKIRSFEKILRNGYYMMKNQIGPGDGAMGHIIDDIFVSLFVEGTARMVCGGGCFSEKLQQPKNFDRQSFSHDDLSSKLVSYLIHEEQYYYTKLCGDRSHHGLSSFFPNWVRLPPSACETSGKFWKIYLELERELSQDEQIKSLQASLCDILMDVLLWSNPYNKDEKFQRSNTSDILLTECQTNPFEAELLLGVNHVLRQKGSIQESVAGTFPMTLVTNNVTHDAICNLFDISSLRLPPLIKTSKNRNALLVEANLILINILDFCKLLSSSGSWKDVQSNGKIMCSLWTLYSAVADEEASRLLISFVEGAYFEAGHWAPDITSKMKKRPDISKSESFSLLSITSPDTLDEHIRYIRWAILGALSRGLTSISYSKTTLSSEEKDEHIISLLQLLPKLCHDLNIGFHGHSGGMTRGLFLLFLEVIDKSVDTINTLIKSSSTHLLSKLKNGFMCFQNAIELIWEVLCENSLQHVSVVNFTLRLSIDKMPALIRRVERALDEVISCNQFKLFIPISLQQCLVGLAGFRAEKISENVGNIGAITYYDESISTKIKRNNLAGKDYPDLYEVGACRGCRAQPSNQDDAGTKKGRPQDIRCEGDLARDIYYPRKPLFSSLGTISWACSSIFIAAAKNWNESYMIIAHGGGQRRQQFRESRVREKSVSLANSRRKELSTLICTLNRVLCSAMSTTKMSEIVEDESSAKDNSRTALQDSQVLWADLLPLRGRLNFCSCLEKIALTLHLSLSKIKKYINSSKGNKIDANHVEHPLDDDVLLESATCVVGLLCSIQSEKMASNIFSGSVRWYVNAKTKSQLPSFSGIETKKNEGDPILDRLSKLFFRLRSLERELLNFRATMNNIMLDDIAVEKVRLLDEMVEALTNKSLEQGVNKHFANLLNQYIGAISASMGSIEVNEIVANLPSEEEDDNDYDLREEKCRKRRGNYVVGESAPVRRSRRMILRSRNETIDEWLALDDQDFGSAPGERYNANDVFADLEDFIVEG